MSVKQKLVYNWKLIFTIVLPIVLLPLLFIKSSPKEVTGLGSGGVNIFDEDEEEKPDTKFKAAYVILIVAIFWMVEALPLAVTSLIPVVLFPLLGVLGTSAISQAYMKETNMMFLGGLIIALAVEYCGLHRRIALRVMTLVGSSPIRLMAGVMLTTMFLSMWMSNTATTAMMVPIVLAVVAELHKTPVDLSPRRTSRAASIKRSSKDFHEVSVPTIEEETQEHEEKLALAKKMYMFAVAYSANIGGTGVITGTGPNLVFQDVNKKIVLPPNFLSMTFATWLAFNVPAMLLNVFVAFIYLTFQYHGIPNWRHWPLISLWTNKHLSAEEEAEKAKEEKVGQMLRSEYKKLGRMSFHEAGVLFVFLVTILLWFTRDPRFMRGWDDEIEGAENGDATAAMLGVLLMFIIPRDLSFLSPKAGKAPQALLDWKYVQQKLSWGMVLLLGGGFALSDASEKSGLSEWIGEQLTYLDSLPQEIMLLIVMILTTFVTEVCSNVATANVLLPILLALSNSLDIHPLYLTVAATVTCSFAFMLPVATPPNAIVFAAGDLKILDMVKAGAALNLSCTIVYFLLTITYGELLFNYSGYKDAIRNNTDITSTTALYSVFQNASMI